MASNLVSCICSNDVSCPNLGSSDQRSRRQISGRACTLLCFSSSVCFCQIFGFLVCMGVILAVGNAVWEREVGSLFQSYLPWDPPVDNFLFSAFLSFWSYVIILNTVVPISLYVRWGGLAVKLLEVYRGSIWWLCLAVRFQKTWFGWFLTLGFFVSLLPCT